MAAASDYLENKMVDHIFRAQTFAAPTTLYISLYTGAPSDSGGGTEVSGGSYARVSVTCSLANWAGTQGAGTTVASSGSSGTTSNNNAITFPTSSASWGLCTHFGIHDAASAGNLLFEGALTSSVTIGSGETRSFAAGALTVQVDN